MNQSASFARQIGIVAAAAALVAFARCGASFSATGPDAGSDASSPDGSSGPSARRTTLACADLAGAGGGDPILVIEISGGPPGGSAQIFPSRTSCGFARFLHATVALDASGAGRFVVQHPGQHECSLPLVGPWEVDVVIDGNTIASVLVTFFDSNCSSVATCDAAAAHCPPATDAGSADAGSTDAGSTDAGFSDAGFADAGFADAGSSCVTRTETFTWTVTASDPIRAYSVPLVPGVTYSHARMEFDFQPTDWGATCYNPFYTPPRLSPPFNYLIDFRRGDAWCLGGNLFEAKLRGGSESDLWVDTYFKPQVFPRCTAYNATEFTVISPRPKHGVSLGQFSRVIINYNSAVDTMVMQIGSKTFSGTAEAQADVRSDSTGDFHIVFGLEEGMECFDSSGAHDPTANCCHIPPIGWTFRNLVYEFCP